MADDVIELVSWCDVIEVEMDEDADPDMIICGMLRLTP